MPRYIDAENIPTKFINFGMPTVICGIEVPDIDSAPTISLDEVRRAGKEGARTMRLIDADKLVAELQKKPIHDGHFIHARDVSDAIFYAPTISPDDVRGVGEWIDYQQGRWVYAQCSECGTVHDVRSNYCPNCGARMSRAEAEKAMEVSEDA